MIPPTPPAIVDDCSAVRHDSAQAVTTSAVNAAVNAIVPQVSSPVVGTVAGNLGGSVAVSAGASTVWTELQAVLQNTSQSTIVGVRLGLKQDDGTYRLLEIPITLSPSFQGIAKQRLASGDAHVGIASCALLSVKFADGTTWTAPPATPAP